MTKSLRITGKEHGLDVGRILAGTWMKHAQVTCKFTSDNRSESRERLNISEDQIVVQVEE